MHPFPGNAVCSGPGARFHFDANLTRATSYLPLLAKPSDNNDGGCIPSFHSPETPQSGLCVVFLCCHRSVAQPGTTRREQGGTRSRAFCSRCCSADEALRVHLRQCWVFWDPVLGVGRARCWRFLASPSLKRCHLCRALSGTVRAFRFAPCLERLSQPSEHFTA